MSLNTRGRIKAVLNRFGIEDAALIDALVAAIDPPVDLNEPRLIGWTWQAHFDDLLKDVRAGKWIPVSKKLALMLTHAIDKVEK
jgi:hypothetical protein